MTFYICTACGTQHAESEQPPGHCVICEEERQYVPPRGQTWTTLEALQQSHTNTFREYENVPLRESSEAIIAIVAIMRDVTKRFEEIRRLKRRLAESSTAETPTSSPESRPH
jgi:hypothetical protein